MRVLWAAGCSCASRRLFMGQRNDSGHGGAWMRRCDAGRPSARSWEAATDVVDFLCVSKHSETDAAALEGKGGGEGGRCNPLRQTAGLYWLLLRRFIGFWLFGSAKRTQVALRSCWGVFFFARSISTFTFPTRSFGPGGWGPARVRGRGGAPTHEGSGKGTGRVPVPGGCLSAVGLMLVLACLVWMDVTA